MSNFDPYELRNVDSDDIDDVLIKIEASFCFKFGHTELKDVKTFGELCDIITNKVQGDGVNDCTTQQAFYKLRNAISATLFIEKNSILPDTALSELFPRYNRRRLIRTIESDLGFKIDVLRPKHWISGTLVMILFASCIGLFIFWKVGLTGFSLSIIGFGLADRLGIELNFQNVGQLAEKISRENYLKSRRNSATVNRNEIAEKVKELFIQNLSIEKSTLTRQASFS